MANQEEAVMMLILAIGIVHNNPPYKTSALLDQSKDANARGFTLIELLTVIAIVGIISAISMFAINTTNKNDDLIIDATRLTSLIELSREEAIMQGRDFGIEFIENGYQFLEYIPNLESWTDLKNDHLLKQRTFPKTLRYELVIENKEIEIKTKKINSSNKTSENLQANKIPHILILSSGDISPFNLHFFTDNDRGIKISGSLGGIININSE